MSFNYELSYIKQNYRNIFSKALNTVLELLDKMQEDYSCAECESCKKEAPGLFDTLPKTCGYIPWQVNSLDFLENTLGGDILLKIKEIQTERNRVACHQCGVCCKLASSQYSFNELLKKADEGDQFASQFTSIFLPYASEKEAQDRFPDTVSEILTEVRNQTQGDETTPDNSTDTAPVYFYHCPYVTEDNQCSIYGTDKRPKICDDYPDTPLTFIYKKCSWKPWKDEYHHDALMAHASIEVCNHLAHMLKQAMQGSSN